MRRSAWRLAWLLCAVVPAAASATTGPDLSARIVVDGRADEYADDERVLGAGTLPPEHPGDSAWGSDNDLTDVAITWDESFLYIAIACVARDSRVFLLIDHTPGGVADLHAAGASRRAIDFSAGSFRPDILAAAEPGSRNIEAVRLGVDRPGPIDAVEGRFVQDGLDGGAAEVAIPWSEVFPAAGTIAVVAMITGDTGTGAGDVAPDSYGANSSLRTDPAAVDRALVIEVDADADGVPDPGVSPRAASSVADEAVPSQRARDGLDVTVDLKSFAPDDGDAVTVSIVGEGEEAVFLSARVYSRDGTAVRDLVRDQRRIPRVPFDVIWDGTDRAGRVVPGGIYIVNVTWGAAPGSRSGLRNVAVVVVK